MPIKTASEESKHNCVLITCHWCFGHSKLLLFNFLGKGTLIRASLFPDDQIKAKTAHKCTAPTSHTRKLLQPNTELPNIAIHKQQREKKVQISYQSEEDTLQGLYLLPIMHPYINVGHLHRQYSYPLYRKHIAAVYYILIARAVISGAIKQA